MSNDPRSHDEKIVTFKRRPPEPSKPATPEESEAELRRTRSNVVALVVAAVLVLAGWLLVRKLGETTRMEDCLMSGRTNCAPIATPHED